MGECKYKTVLLKLSGEALQGDTGFGLCPDTLERIALQVAEAARSGVRIGMVIGGGNIFRGQALAARGLNRVTGDHMGMLATVINALAMQDALERQGLATRVQSAISMYQITEPFIRRKAVRHLEKGRVVIFASGTGHPYFTTDTAAVLRASEIGADIILKATNVDGIYDRDPRKDPAAVLHHNLTYMGAIRDRLEVMDTTAFSLAMENRIPLLVFNLTGPDHIRRAIEGEAVGTMVNA
ncbi:uridylate kinase [Deltaproteobacteria bacterium]|nr:uridylate kinase [Deltaproteobacteria bacterium]